MHLGNNALSTLHDIANDIVEHLHPAKRVVLKKIHIADLVKLQCTFGKEVRHAYGLWHSNPLTEKWRDRPELRVFKNGLDISDDNPYIVSQKIMYLVWKKVNE